MQRFETGSELQEAVARGRTAVLFHATWCPYCRRFKPHFERLIDGASGWRAAEVVLDDDEDPLWDEHAIDVIPVVVLFEDGRVVKRIDARRGADLRPAELASALA